MVLVRRKMHSHCGLIHNSLDGREVIMYRHTQRGIECAYVHALQSLAEVLQPPIYFQGSPIPNHGKWLSMYAR